MKCHCYSRGRKVELEELENVVAVKSPPEEAARADAPATRATREVHAALRESTERGLPETIAPEKARGFERAGWSFIQPTAAAREAMRAADARDLRESVAKVYLRHDDQIVIGTGLITVRFRPDLSEADARARLEKAECEVVNHFKFAPNLFEARVVSGKDPIDVANALQEDEATVYAEPVLIEHVEQRQPFTPTDPQYGQQWQWKNDGSFAGTAGADISAEDAWEKTRGAGVRIAVIDNGFDVDHEDLSAAVLSSSGHFKNQPGGNAKFENTLANFPDANHGTFCAGMAAARANNGVGGCGAAPEAGLILIASLGDQVGTQVTLARAVAYAADPSTEIDAAPPADGAHIIVCSLGPNVGNWALTSVLDDALSFAITSGRGGLGSPIFWATSNGNFPVLQDEVVSHQAVIAVGRSTRQDTENNSAFGPKLEFLAPGVSVFSTKSGNTYGSSTGTSYAAPCAAGVGALLLAHRPALTWQQVRQAMRDGCKKIGGVTYDLNGRNDDYGFGRIDALATLTVGEALDREDAQESAAVRAPAYT